MSRLSRVMILVVTMVGAGLLLLQTAEGGQAAPQAPTPQVARAQAPPAARTVSPQRAVVDKYCVTCHNEKRPTAGLALDRANMDVVSADGEMWERVVRKLRAGAMPPAGMPRPDKATYAAVSSFLESALDKAAAVKPNPGRTIVHRLNRTEYANVVRDLLALDVDGRALLPADDAGYGFDNVADLLSVSPSLLDRYMSAAQRIARLAVADPAIRPGVETYRLPMDLIQNDRMSEDMPFGSRGGISARHNFPLDGEYLFKIRLQRHWENIIRGLGEPNQIDVFLDGQRIKVFTRGGKFPGVGGRGSAAEIEEWEQIADDGLELRVPVTAGPHLIAVTFPRSVVAPEGLGLSRMPAKSFSFAVQTYDVKMGIDNLAISGPFNASTPRADTPSRSRIFVCRPTGAHDEEACATKILTTLARRAYRRPVTESDTKALVSFYRQGKAEAGFERGIEWALERILVSPDFLFRIERDPANLTPGVPYRVSDVELASRVAFFIWSSIPDEELLEAGVRGRLKDPKVLEEQVRRMLADPRARTVMNNFGAQWVHVRNMRAAAPDASQFPEFDETLRDAFQRETELFLEAQWKEDRGALDLLTANYTFVNERLAQFYGIPNVYGSHFRRVTLPDDRRAGLLGQGSILTVTSYPNRTSPVLRGKWLLENLLGAPPPAPPPNVPPLAENGEGVVPTSVRERLEQHRKNPVCATCHARMDPLGFALENFDAIGQWRTLDTNSPINPSGVLPDGTKFNGPAEFRQALLLHSEEFVGTITEKLMTYALGRGIEHYDMPSIRKIVKDAGASDYRWSSLVLGVVKSNPFQMRMAQDPTRPTPTQTANTTSSQTRRAQ